MRAFAPAICAALSLLVGARELGLFSTSLSLPLRYSYVDDTKFYLALIKGVLDHGWWTTNPSLGFPFGQQLYDFPQGGDTLNLVLIHGIGLFSGNPAWVANVFLLLTFPLNALAAFFVLRRFDVSRPASVAAAVIFSVLPYSFAHVSQLLLAAYYSVPLAAYLFLRVVSGEPLFERGARGWVTRRSVVTVALCAIVGLADLYYAAFAIVLILAGALVVAITGRSIRALVPGVLVAAAIGVVLAVALAPSFVYRSGHGTNPALARTTVDTRTLGLQFTGLVLPVRGHRVSFLSHLNQRYFDPRGTPSYCEACSETIGTVGDVGLVWLLALALTGIVGVGRLSPRFALDRRAALGVALSLVIGTVSGVSGLIGLFVTNDIRAWNRMSLFIAFFSLLAAGLLLDRAGGWLLRRTGRRWFGGVLAAVVLVVGVADVTSRYYVPVPQPTEREWLSDAAFVRQIERRMPHDAAVFELPQVPFPEGYNEAAYGESTTEHGGFPTSYELLRGYLHSTGLRWSFGAMKGREADWASELATKPLPFVVDAAAADGFDGLWVDLHGYGVHNRGVVLAQSQRLTGSAPLISRLHDLAFFDLRRLRAAQSRTQAALLRADTLHPLRTTCTPTGLALYNPSPRPRPALLTFTLVAGGEGKTVRIHYPDGALEIQQPPHGGTRVVRRLDVAPGTERVRFSYVGPLATPRIPVDGPSVVAPDLSDTALASLGAGRPGFMAGLSPPPCTQTVLPLQDQLPAPNPASSG